MAGVEAVLAQSCGSVQFCVFLDTQGLLGFTYIGMLRFFVAGDVIDGSHYMRFKYPRQDVRCALYIGEA